MLESKALLHQMPTGIPYELLQNIQVHIYVYRFAVWIFIGLYSYILSCSKVVLYSAYQTYYSFSPFALLS